MSEVIETNNEAIPVIQRELPLAIVDGQPWLTLPEDLYIPPDALEVILEAFEGPLDLLLYLIKRQNLDIVDIPLASITQQYIHYIELMQVLRLELAAEYLVMAAMLAEIKSRMLLPRSSEATEEEDDPRADLVRRLQEYERFKYAALDLDELPRFGRDVYWAKAIVPDMEQTKPLPDVTLKELLLAFKDILSRSDLKIHHQIQREVLSVRERMTIVLDKLQNKSFINFGNCFNFDEGRAGVVVTFIAILELVKQSLIHIVQTEPYGPIHLKASSES